MANQMPITLPPRHYDAKYALLVMAFLGEFVQGERLRVAAQNMLSELSL